jgi:hypothetical protein
MEPCPKQQKFLKAAKTHAAYGGARCGGKSKAARAKTGLHALNYPGIQVLFLREALCSASLRRFT